MSKLSRDTLYSVRRACRYQADVEPLPYRLDEQRLRGIREGSYARAEPTASTTDIMAMAVKNSLRTFENSITLIAYDCGTREAASQLITEENHQLFVGRYMLGYDKPLKAEDLREYIDETIQLRVPTGCKVPSGSYCQMCASGFSFPPQGTTKWPKR